MRLSQANLVTETNFDNTDFLVFQPINRYFKVIANTDYVSSWKCKGLSPETIKPPTTSDNSLTPALSYYDTKTRVNYWKLFKTIKNFMHSWKSSKHFYCLSTWCI